MSEARARRPHWERLGGELRRLREFTGLTQRGIAAALRISQTSVDRIEKGGPDGKPPAWPKIQAWAATCEAAGPDMPALRALAEAALDEHRLFRNWLPAGLTAIQEDIRLEEADAGTLRNFNPWGIPGLFQTAAYARRVLTLADYHRLGDVDDAVRVRMLRQEILYDDKHQFEFVMTEAGLRWRPGPLPVLAAQLAHLAAMVALPSVTFSVIPSGVLAHAIPRCGFILFENITDGGDPFVAVEIDHQRVTVTEAGDVDIYRAQYGLLRRSAINGDEAVAFVRQVAESIRSPDEAR